MQRIGAQFADRLTIWTVSDGRAGVENQALGLAEAVARRSPARIVQKRIGLRTPWAWAPAGLIPAPREALTISSDPIEPPWPDLWIGSGRASLAFSMGVRSWSAGRTFVVQMQDPRINPREFDLLFPPAHDGLEGANVVPLLGAAHRVTLERIAAGAAAYPRVLAALPGPRFAVLIGGRSKRQDISPNRARIISRALGDLAQSSGGSLMVTLSRRTGRKAAAVFREQIFPHAALAYDGEGDNPYFAMLAACDAILVTADSVSMATEAAATGKPVLLIPVDGPAGKLGAFHEALIARGCARWFEGGYAPWIYEPLRETDRAAAIVMEALVRRAGRGA